MTLGKSLSNLRCPGALTVYFGLGDENGPDAERRFFSSLRLPNGTWKVTYDRRLDDLNALISRHLRADRTPAVMDVAAASGISSLEWVDQLRGSGRDPRMVVGDLYVSAWLTTFGTRCAVLYLDSGWPLSIEIGEYSRGLQSDRWIDRMIRPLLRALFVAGRLLALGGPLTPPRRWRWIHRKIPLVSPRLLHRTDVEVVTDDLSEAGPFSGQFDAVRAANILNRAYFPDGELIRMAANLIGRVRLGGLLAVCRTHPDGTNHATLFRRTESSVIVEGRLGEGSEVEDLVLSLIP